MANSFKPLLPWLARDRRPAPSDGRLNCWSRPRKRRRELASSAAKPSAGCKKNCIKPWRKLMWCVGTLTQEYRQRMYDLLDLYDRPLRPGEPVV
ncbi:MAG: hypothetical protein L0H12_00285, partial [Nitrosospira sp.]|nr:hypothetical protein [Nitrosospira sp.]